MAKELFTIGHSNHDEQHFLQLLEDAGVEMLADVRVSPRSRLPHFNGAALAAALEGAGIEYLGLGEQLGGRREPVGGSPNAGWDDEAFQGYADHMASEDFAAGIETLATAASERRAAVMCAEGDWRHCHRRLIADALLVRGWSVSHLLGDAGAQPHELTGFAVVDGETITYPPEQTSLGV